MKTIDTRGAKNETTAGVSSSSTGTGSSSTRTGIAVCHLAIGPIGRPVCNDDVQHVIAAVEVEDVPIEDGSEVVITIGPKGSSKNMEKNEGCELVGVINQTATQKAKPEASQKPEEKEPEQRPLSLASQNTELILIEEQAEVLLGGKENLKRAIENGEVKVYKQTDRHVEGYAISAKSVSYSPNQGL